MDDVRVVDEDQSLHHLDNKPGRFIIRLGQSGSTMAMEKKKDSTINLLHFSSVRSYTEEPTFEKSSPPCTDSISSRKACTSRYLQILQDQETMFPLLVIVEHGHYPLPLHQREENLGLMLHLRRADDDTEYIHSFF